MPICHRVNRTLNPVRGAALALLGTLVVLAGCARTASEPSWGDFLGWFDYQYGGASDLRVRVMYAGMPNGEALLPSFNFHTQYRPVHTPDGHFRAYHYSGPFRGLLAVKARMTKGRLDGPVTFWSGHGRVKEQLVFREDLLVERRTDAPWLDGAKDQSLPDGVYTFVSPDVSQFARWQVVSRQEVYRGGRLVQTVTTNGQWLPIEKGFWLCLAGRLICVPTPSGNDWFIDARKLANGDRVLLRGRREPVIVKLEPGRLRSSEIQPRFTNESGESFDLSDGGAIYAWP